MQRLFERLKAKVKLLELLSEGCPRHPAYRAKRKATGRCESCVKIWNARQELISLEKFLK
tara:strand:+ start:184 stop:363 length:180 start_codon:yes stop_codon:yes gene_type:complete